MVTTYIPTKIQKDPRVETLYSLHYFAYSKDFSFEGESYAVIREKQRSPILPTVSYCTREKRSFTRQAYSTTYGQKKAEQT